MNELPTQESNSLLVPWRRKFACALRGLVIGVRGQNSFYIHIPVALAVVVLASWLRVSLIEWAVLIVCITIVFSAELFNSALESLALAITRESNPEIRDALDVASGAVLAASLGASVVGMLIVGWPLLRWLAGCCC